MDRMPSGLIGCEHLAQTLGRKSSTRRTHVLLQTAFDHMIMSLREVRIWLTEYRLTDSSLAVFNHDKDAEEHGAAAARSCWSAAPKCCT